MLPTPRPTFETPNHVHQVTSTNEQTLGTVRSSGGSSELNCTIRYSPLSDIGDDATVEVMCEKGEVMTDCSMMTEVKYDGEI